MQQWCGAQKDDQPLTLRLLEFANQDWRNKALVQMSFSRYCPGQAFCEKTTVKGNPTSLTGADGWTNLLKAEVGRDIVSATRMGEVLADGRH